MPYTSSVDLDALEGVARPENGTAGAARSGAGLLTADHGYGHGHSPSAVYSASFAQGEDGGFAGAGSYAPSTAATISHAYGTDPDTSTSDQFYYDQDLPWPFSRLSQHPSARHYDAHFATQTWASGGFGGSATQAHSSLALRVLTSCARHLEWMRRGLHDANQWPKAWRLVANSPQIRMGVIKGLLLSSVISALVFFFELAFFPKQLLQQRQSAAAAVAAAEEAGASPMAWINAFLLYPLIGGCYLLAASWTSQVATAAYHAQRGGDKAEVAAAHARSASEPPAGPPPFSVAGLAAQAYRFVLVANYTLLSLAITKLCSIIGITWIRWIGTAVNFGLISFIDSYYCFELLWIAKGWGFEKRARYAELRWSYMMAFGIPSTLVSFFHPSGLLNLMLFMLVFPVCTVLALLADPQPHDTAIVASLVPGRLCVLFPTVRIHRWLVRNVVTRAAYSRMGLSHETASHTAAAIGSGLNRAFVVGKTSTAARFAQQVWNDATHSSHQGYRRPSSQRNGDTAYGGYGCGYGNGYAPATTAAAAPYGSDDATAAGAASYGYANAMQYPMSAPRIGSAPPPRRPAAAQAQLGAQARTPSPLAPPPRGPARGRSASPGAPDAFAPGPSPLAQTVAAGAGAEHASGAEIVSPSADISLRARPDKSRKTD